MEFQDDRKKTGMIASKPSGGALAEASENAVRAPKSRIAMVLHLSQMRDPPPRAYHRRIARAALQDAAQAYAGEMFELEDGDMVLLCHTSAGGHPALHPTTLPHAMHQLFRVDLLPNHHLTTVWLLERDGAPFLEYVAAKS